MTIPVTGFQPPPDPDHVHIQLPGAVLEESTMTPAHTSTVRSDGVAETWETLRQSRSISDGMHSFLDH